MKRKREIRFVLTGSEIELLKDCDTRFYKEFTGKKLQGTRWEFTYSYEALEWLMHKINATTLFISWPPHRRKLEKLTDKIEKLLRLSDSLSYSNLNPRIKK